jgi:nitroreductase
MKPVENETIVRQLNWRYATKKFDPAHKIQAADWRTLAQSLLLAPSSFGLQPFKFFVVENPEVRAKLRAAAWDQSQITDASHLVVFAVKRDVGPADVQRLVDRIADVRGVPVESLEAYKQSMLGSLSRPADQVAAWASRQPYIALGNFLTAAALLGVDACPMEGFDADQFDQILGLDKSGYRAQVMVTAGYRADDDAYAKLVKVRFPAEEVITVV